jgi:hypothetical protein
MWGWVAGARMKLRLGLHQVFATVATAACRFEDGVDAMRARGVIGDT